MALSKHPCLPSTHWPARSFSNAQSDRVTGLSKPIDSFLLLFRRKPGLSTTGPLCLPDLMTPSPPHSGRVPLSRDHGRLSLLPGPSSLPNLFLRTQGQYFLRDTCSDAFTYSGLSRNLTSSQKVPTHESFMSCLCPSCSLLHVQGLRQSLIYKSNQ